MFLSSISTPFPLSPNSALFYSLYSMKIPVIMSPEDGCFPGLYTPSVLSKPWLSDGRTMIVTSVWGSRQVILSVNVLRYL